MEFKSTPSKHVISKVNVNNSVDKNTVSYKSVEPTDGQGDQGIMKAYIPNFLYKPPYGWPREVNTPYLRQLARNTYVFSVIKTLADEATCIPWEIVTKDEDNEGTEDLEPVKKQIASFLRNPNGNEESFESLMRKLITDILEVDSGVLVKVFDGDKNLKGMFCRPGDLFLKNPDIYGYMGNRNDFVMPLPDNFTGANINFDNPTQQSVQQQQLLNQYNNLFRNQAAYYQYGWTAGNMPVPFGNREIIYMMQNPRSDTIYGRSPLEILGEIVQTLVYGSQYNLDFYTNNNMPDGVIQLLGAEQEQIEQFRANYENQFRYTDNLGSKRKKFYNAPISNTEVSFTPFQLQPKDMEVLGQQEWFTKVLWMCFGVTAEEMGFTENSNKATSESQTKLAKRKALKPLLKVIEYHFNSQLIPEFFTENDADKSLPLQEDVPVLFKFIDYNADEDKQKHDILEQELRMGVKTPIMVAKELDVDLDELKEELAEKEEKEMAMFEKQQNNFNNNNFADTEEAPEDKNPKKKDNKNKDSFPKKKEEKALTDAEKVNKVADKQSNVIQNQLDKHIDEMGDALLDLVDKLPENPRL